MSDRSFLDTNIFIYTFDSHAPAKAARARRLVQEALTRHCGVISYQVVQEFFNVALRRFVIPLTQSEALEYLTIVLRPLLAVESSSALYEEALLLHNRYRLSWYDSLIVAAASQSACTILYTEDLQHGLSIGDLRIVNPFLNEQT